MLHEMFASPESDDRLFNYIFRTPKRINFKILRIRKNLSQIFRNKTNTQKCKYYFY